MLKRTQAILLVGALLSMLPVSAHPLQWNGPLTQAQVIARAQQSFDAQLAELDAQSATAQEQVARAQAMPQISVSGTVMNSTLIQLGMPAARQTYGSLTASVPIFAPQAWDAIRASGDDASAARAAAAMAVNQAVTDAVRAYDAAALARALAQQRAADVRDQRSHLATTQERVRTGAAPRYLIAQDEAALAHAQQSEEDARARAVRAMHALEVLLDLGTASTPVVALVPPSLTLAPNVAVLEQRAYAERPDVLAAQRLALAAQQRVRRARAEYLPTITATAQTYNGLQNPALGSTGSAIGVSASLPLFDAGSRSADLRMAEIAYARARITLDRTRLQAQADVLDAVRDLRAARRNVATANSELRYAEAELRVARLRERVGKGIELETLDALATLAGAREDVLQATARYDDALAALHRSVGAYAPAAHHVSNR